MKNILLIDMPFSPPLIPSAGLSLLKKSVETYPFNPRVLYLKLLLVEMIGLGDYDLIFSGGGLSISSLAAMFAEERNVLFDSLRMVDFYLPENIGEWLFAETLFGKFDAAEEEYVKEVPSVFLGRLREIKSLIPSFIEACHRKVMAENPWVVAFTSTFQQHLATLCLARRIKESAPEVTIIMGGPNCESVMGKETLRQFPFLDVVVSGEGDLVFPQLIGRLRQRKSLCGIPGVFTSEENGDGTAAPCLDLDTLPVPDYTDFFHQLQKTGIEVSGAYQPVIPVQMSRGCWWGEKKQCRFCGLNGKGIRFRARSREKAVELMDEVARKYPPCPVIFADNMLSRDYYNNFFNRIQNQESRVFCETKVDLSRSQLRALSAAGASIIQPGIESLSTKTLALIRKGTNLIRIVRFLKDCAQTGVRPVWNFLWGFPFEEEDEYFRMGQLMPSLYHLQPPLGCYKFQLHRFSEYFNNFEAYGLAGVRPHASYRHIYPFAEETLRNLVYYFEFEHGDGKDESYIRQVEEKITSWKEIFPSAELICTEGDDGLHIFDSRDGTGKEKEFTLCALQREICLLCEMPRTVTTIHAACLKQEKGGDPQLVDECLRFLLDRRLLVFDNDSYLFLGVWAADV